MVCNGSYYTPFLHLSNKLAEKGHKISFFIPTKTKQKFEASNFHKDLITFIPVSVPQVEGLPPGTETTADVPFTLIPLVMTAMDITKPAIEAALQELKPHLVFFDFTHWLPALTRRLNIKAVHYCIISPATVGFLDCPERKALGKHLTEAVLMKPPPEFPPSSIKLQIHEARTMISRIVNDLASDFPFSKRLLISMSDCDAIAFKTCREMEGPYLDYVEKQFKKPVFSEGPVIPEPPASVLEEKWAKWLDKFEAGSVIFCAIGSECTLKLDQFQELVLGFELTGLPFLAALKPPIGAQTIESALPEGFEERVKERGSSMEDGFSNC